MKRIVFLCCLAILVMLISCAEKLPTNPHPNGPDTVYIHDTLPVYDTAFDTTWIVDTVIIGDSTVYDTTIIIDTVVVTDTLVDTITVTDTIMDTTVIIDTVYVDAGQQEPLCGTLRANVKRLDWFVPLDTGVYTLYFSGSTDSDQPPQQLTVQIGETRYDWPIASQKELELTISDQSPGVWVSITAQPPPARGHAIRICLQIQTE